MLVKLPGFSLSVLMPLLVRICHHRCCCCCRCRLLAGGRLSAHRGTPLNQHVQTHLSALGAIHRAHVAAARARAQAHALLADGCQVARALRTQRESEGGEPCKAMVGRRANEGGGAGLACGVGELREAT